jgi:hypothetical protein
MLSTGTWSLLQHKHNPLPSPRADKSMLTFRVDVQVFTTQPTPCS